MKAGLPSGTGVKNPDPEDLALSCPQRGLLGSFLHAKVR